MTIDQFLIEYGSVLFGSYAIGWGSGYLFLSFKKGLETIF